MADAHWERRPDALWASIDDRDGDEFIAAMGELDDAVRAFLALALTSVGRKREAVSIALTAPAAHLPRYTARSRATRASWPERSRRPAPAP